MTEQMTSECNATASSESTIDHGSYKSTLATLTSDGQTTIPKEIREQLALKAGDQMTFTLLPDGVVLMRVKNKSAMSVAGLFYKKDRKAIPTKDLSR